MPFQINSKLTLSCAAALVLAALVYWQWPADPPPINASVAAADAKRVWNGPIGPGVMSSGGTHPVVVDDVDFEEVPPDVVRIDERGRLITDVQLHNAMDSYLLHTDVPSRQIAADKLRAYLGRRLAGAPASDAQALVTKYLAYMDEHDAALARMAFARPGADGLSEQSAAQFAAWQERRRSMRQVMLGPTIYKEWFAAEDGRCAALLAAVQGQQGATGNTVPESESDANRVGRGPAPPHDASPAHDALDCATELARSFTAIEAEERQWTRHLRRYRDALERLEERDPARRTVRLAALRQQIFSNDAERERVQTMNMP